MSATVEKIANPIAEVRLQLTAMEDQFKAALPSHMPVERFCRVVMTAVQNNGDLVKCSRRSLWSAAMKAAQDGLLPDGRDGAIVAYKSEAQWMPMIGGLRKKARNSGEIETWEAHVVHANDAFEFELGDNPFIRHKPTLDDEGPVIAAYSICTLKSGEKTREVMSIRAIEKIHARSKAGKSGPWVTDFEEMCRKTVARRHSKVIPMSSDLDDLIRRDDELYDHEQAAEDAREIEQPARKKTVTGRLDDLLGHPEPQTIDATPIEPEPVEQEGAGEIIEGEFVEDAPTKSEDEFPGDTPSILYQAREHAMQGRRVFDVWYGDRNEVEVLLLAQHMKTLMAAAKNVDAAAKKG